MNIIPCTLFVIASFLSLSVVGQNSEAVPKIGYEKLTKDLSRNLVLTTSEIHNNISGDIIVEFRVNENGRIDSADIIKDLGDQIALRLIRMLKASGDWNPAIKENKPVATWVRLPYHVLSTRELAERPDHLAVPEKGMKDFNENFSKNFEYPKEALNAGVKGQFNLRFTVDINGRISNIAFDRDPGYSILNNAKRALLRSGKWIPAKENGSFVSSEVVYPMTLDFKSFRSHL